MQHGNTRIKQNKTRRLDHANQEVVEETKFKHNLMSMMENFKKKWKTLL